MSHSKNTQVEENIMLVQLGQAGTVLRRMAAMCQELAVKPLAIFTGDFNSTPGSAIYSFVQQVRVSHRTCHQELRVLSAQRVFNKASWHEHTKRSMQKGVSLIKLLRL